MCDLEKSDCKKGTTFPWKKKKKKKNEGSASFITKSFINQSTKMSTKIIWGKIQKHQICKNAQRKCLSKERDGEQI